MTLYFDTSVIVPLFITDPLTERAETLIRTTWPVAMVSDYSEAEFASAVSRRVRIGDIGRDAAQIVFSQFDAWIARGTQKIEFVPADLSTAASFVRRLDLPLKTGDAIQIAMTHRIGAILATFDRQMLQSAIALGCG